MVRAPAKLQRAMNPARLTVLSLEKTTVRVSLLELNTLLAYPHTDPSNGDEVDGPSYTCTASHLQSEHDSILIRTHIHKFHFRRF